MHDFDPYVADPTEPIPQGRLGWLRPWLILAVVLLLGLSISTIGFVTGRQDPSLEFPAELFSDPPASDPPVGAPPADAGELLPDLPSAGSDGTEGP